MRVYLCCLIAAVNSSGVEQSMYQLMVGTIALCSLVIIIDLVAIIYACRKAYTTYSDGLYKHRSELTVLCHILVVSSCM